MTKKLDELKEVVEFLKTTGAEVNIQIVYTVGSGSVSSDPNVPPPTPVKPERSVLFKDTANNNVPTYDLPDVNSTKCMVWEKNDAIESVPPPGHKGMPKETDLIAREAHAQNLFKEWAWLPRQLMQKASLKTYSFPDTGVQGQNLTDYPGMWVPRSSLSTPSSQAWIDSLVAYLKTQW